MRKRLLIAIIIILVLAGFCIWFIGKNNTKEEEKVVTYKIKTVHDETDQYHISYIDVPEGMMDGTRYYFYRAGKILHFNALDEDAAGKNLFSVTAYDMDSKQFQKTDLDFSEISAAKLKMLGVTPYLDNGFVVLLLDMDKPQKKEGVYQSYLVVLDSEYHVSRYESILYDDWICQIAADDEGNIAIAGESDYSVRVYDRNLSLLFKEESPTGGIYSFVGNVGGRIAVIFPDMADQVYYGVCDPEQKRFSASYLTIQSNHFNSFDSRLLYLNEDDNLCSYLVGDEYATSIVNFTKYGIEKYLLNPALEVGEDRFVYPIKAKTDGNMQEICQWAIISKDASADTRHKISFAVTGDYPQKAVSEFNRSNTDFYIEIQDYSDQDGLERLEKEIISGKIPDFIDTSNIDLEAFVEKGILCEISKYADKAGILSDIRSALTVEGGLYDLPYTYRIACIRGNTAILPDMTRYSPLELEAIMSGHEVGYLISGMLGSDFILDIIRGDERQYLSADNSAFTSDEFVELLELVKNRCFSEKTFTAQELINMSFENGDYLYEDGMIVALSMISDYEEQEADYFVTGAAVGKVQTPTIILDCAFAMTTSCEYPEVFEQFADFVYEENLVQMPITDQQLEYYLDEMGDFSSEEKNAISAFMASTAKNRAWRNYCGYASIIEEEVEKMIDQSLTPEETAEKIQTRMNIYIHENE